MISHYYLFINGDILYCHHYLNYKTLGILDETEICGILGKLASNKVAQCRRLLPNIRPSLLQINHVQIGYWTRTEQQGTLIHAILMQYAYLYFSNLKGQYTKYPASSSAVEIQRNTLGRWSPLPAHTVLYHFTTARSIILLATVFDVSQHRS